MYKHWIFFFLDGSNMSLHTILPVTGTAVLLYSRYICLKLNICFNIRTVVSRCLMSPQMYSRAEIFAPCNSFKEHSSQLVSDSLSHFIKHYCK